MVDEPTYVEAGDEFGDLQQKRGGRAGWQTPKGKWQKRILKAAHRKYYKAKAQGGRAEQHDCNEIARQAVPMEVSTEGWPEEWVEFCCQWCEGKWMKGQPVMLVGLISFILNTDAKNDWVASRPKPDMKPKEVGEWRMYDED